MDIRLLTANEIECRVQSVKKTNKGVGCILLIYKDARVDQKILDETFTPFGWQRDHKELKGNIYCGIGVKSGDWIWKWDCGAESNTEKEKGEASDSFKRAGFNWGIGRELYTAPFIWVDLKDGEYDEDKGKITLSYRVKFEVKSIEYNSDREIVGLQIKDNHGVVRYDLKSPVKPQNPPQQTKPSSNGNHPPEPQQGGKNEPTDVEKRATKIYYTMTGSKEGQHGWSVPEYKEWLKGFKEAKQISTAYGKEWTLQDVEFIESQIKALPF